MRVPSPPTHFKTPCKFSPLTPLVPTPFLCYPSPRFLWPVSLQPSQPGPRRHNQPPMHPLLSPSSNPTPSPWCGAAHPEATRRACPESLEGVDRTKWGRDSVRPERSRRVDRTEWGGFPLQASFNQNSYEFNQRSINVQSNSIDFNQPSITFNQPSIKPPTPPQSPSTRRLAPDPASPGPAPLPTKSTLLNPTPL